MTEFDFDTPIDRSATASLKWELYRDRDIIPLWVADMDFKAPPAVIDALHARVAHGVFGYTVPPGDLVELVVARLQDKYAWEFQPSSIIWLPGLVSGLNLTCRSMGKTGDEVMTLTPIYPPFLTAPGLSGRTLSRVPLVQGEKDEWRLDIDRLEHAFTDRTALFLLCNPHNPTGRIFNRRELTDIAAVCEQHDVVICSDEIHCDLLLDKDKKHIPIASLSPEIADRTITLMAPSKTFNIPGLGCSFAVIPNPELRSRFRRSMYGITPDVNLFGYEAAMAAYRDGHAWLEALIDYLVGNRALVEKVIRETAGLKVNHVEATYLAWIDARSLAMDSPAAFFENAGVGLSNGKDFGGPGFLRLNFGCPRPTLEKALKRMTTAL
ncbi:MAG: PatB family C-S lyase [Deltaproteobacteria bacterium]|nr:PatB family C-S lyase [Deltaproteobacteria bacterium]